MARACGQKRGSRYIKTTTSCSRTGSAERKDEVAPEVAQLKNAENRLEETSARIVH